MNSYINDYSWKCLLGKQSKNISTINNIYLWEVGKRKHFCTNKILTLEDFELIKNRAFHYLSIENCIFIKQHFNITRDKQKAVVIDLSKMEFKGNDFKSIRHALNRAKKYELTQETNFRNINDIKDMIEDWSNNLALKYFRDFSGKNLYFYQNNFHKNCLNVFLYDKDKLVAFATASPKVNNSSTYIIGKALCNKYYGLSEYADYLLYQKCLQNETTLIDLGQTTGGLIHYKTKFPGAFTYEYYNGKINEIR